MPDAAARRRKYTIMTATWTIQTAQSAVQTDTRLPSANSGWKSSGWPMGIGVPNPKSFDQKLQWPEKSTR